jgi:hypothetical protein
MASEGSEIKRAEYRVVVERRGERWEGAVREDLELAREEAQDLCGDEIQIQRRTVTETPWEDVTDA